MIKEHSSIRRVQIVLQGGTAPVATPRQSGAIVALAAIVNVSPATIEVYGVYTGSIVLDLGLPEKGVQRLRALLLANSAQLRMLGVEKVVLEKSPGKLEGWGLKSGAFKVEVAPPALPLVDIDRPAVPQDRFKPIPQIWLFHFIYLVVTITLAGAIFPYSPFTSLLLISGICALGLILVFFRRFMAAHVLALAIGLGTPVVVLAWLLPNQTTLLFISLILAIFLARKYLF